MDKSTAERIYDKIILLEPSKIEKVLKFFHGKVDSNLTLIQSIDNLPIKYRVDFSNLLKQLFK